MARPKLSRPDQPLPLRLLLGLYEFFASLKLAVVLILSLAAVLCLATFIESNLGAAGARYYVYQSDSFLVLLGLLATNVFCAASIRFPWKRYQTGFVITHIGLLVLLGGSAYSFRHSLNSQLLVYKGTSSDVAVDLDADGDLIFDGLPGRTTPLRYRHHPGPFNWQDLEPPRWQRELATWLGRDDVAKPWVHPPEPIYETAQSNLRVEIVDFYAKSEVKYLPFVGLRFKQPAMDMQMPIDIEYREFSDRLQFGEAKFGGIGSVLLGRTARADELDGFIDCKPERTVEGDGAVVIALDGEVEHLAVSQLRQSQAAHEPVPLGKRYTLELIQYAPVANIDKLFAKDELSNLNTFDNKQKNPAVELKITEVAVAGGSVPPRSYRLFCLAEFPFHQLNREIPPGLTAAFYHPAAPGRVDILEGPGQKLAYRVWQQKLGRVVASGALHENEPVSTWSMGGGKAVWEMTLTDYRPRLREDEPYRVFSEKYDKDDRGASRRVKIRVSWDDPAHPGRRAADEFWLRQNSPPPWQRPGADQVQHTRLPEGMLTTQYQIKVTDIGFTMRLDDFDLRVDPGTPTAGNYTSFVTISDVRNNPRVRDLEARLKSAASHDEHQQLSRELAALTKTLVDQLQAQADKAKNRSKSDATESEQGTVSQHVITMNEPLDYPDTKGRILRFFQENYGPPAGDGTPLYSIFRVNYDPGRWIKYLGSLLVTAGIFTMFYMRAYFFKPVQRATPRRDDEAGAACEASALPREQQRV